MSGDVPFTARGPAGRLIIAVLLALGSCGGPPNPSTATTVPPGERQPKPQVPAQRKGPGMSDIAVKNGAWVIPAGVDFADPGFRREMEQVRSELRRKFGPIQRPEALQKCFVETMAFLYDRRLYDAETQTWRIEPFLDRGEKEFGGYDQVILWQSYPRLGVDERNQFDLYRDLPGGGVRVLRQWTDACHRRGIRVLLTYNPWDRHTRQGNRHRRDMLEALKASGADGVYLDTMHAPPKNWAKELATLGRHIAFESEGTPTNEGIAAMHSNWGQGWQIYPPGQVFDRRWVWPRHKTFLTHHRHRRNHWEEVCCGLFTGSGVLVWEDVFGNDTPWVERDKALLRAVKPILRTFWRNFARADWQPFIPSGRKGLKVNRWPGPLGTVYTLYWNEQRPYRGLLFDAKPGRVYADLVTGRPLPALRGKVVGAVAAHSVGAVLEVPALTRAVQALLKSTCPGKLPAYVKVSTERLRPTGRAHRTPRLSYYKGVKPDTLPDGMAWVPGGAYTFKVDHPWHGASCYAHSSYGWKSKGKAVTVRGFAIDVHPVTNEQFALFLLRSGYKPKDEHRFLRHWPGGRYPEKLAGHPVVFVSMEDARAYAKWVGKRLPSEIEWQFAAQGSTGRPWPWGKTFDAGRVNGTGATRPVGAGAKDASPFGVRDLCGHVWQWVDDVYIDNVHRFTVLKGGSFYRLPADASTWYVHSGPLRVDSHVKLPLLAPATDRFSTVGFRCVID